MEGGSLDYGGGSLDYGGRGPLRLWKEGGLGRGWETLGKAQSGDNVTLARGGRGAGSV